MSDKTEQPTPRRLRRARQEGDSGASGYAAQAVAFLAAVALAPAAVRATAQRTSEDLRAATSAAAASGLLPTVDPLRLATEVIALASPILAAAGLTAAVAYAVQTSGVVAAGRIAPNLDRLDPATGLRAIFSAPRLFAVVRALFAACAVGGLACAALREHVVEWALLSGRLGRIAPAISVAARTLALRAAFVGLVLGALDVAVTRRSWLRRLRMTKDEVRREHRDAEGDPQLKAARDRAYHEMIAQATIAEVKTASVVVVNPTHLACALRYGDRERYDAPIVTAKGAGSLAARIVAAAREHGVPIVQDAPLARALVAIEIGDVISEPLYEAVALILAEIARSGEASGRLNSN